MKRAAAWSRLLVPVAGLMGLSGVAIAAAGAHLAGGDLARTAAEFLLIHAAVVLALVSSEKSSSQEPGLLAAAGILAFGASLFGFDLAFAAFKNIRPLPFAAPVGGFGMLIGWLLVVVIGARACFRQR